MNNKKCFGFKYPNMFFPGINAFFNLARLSLRSFPQASNVDVSLFSSVRPHYSVLYLALSMLTVSITSSPR